MRESVGSQDAAACLLVKTLEYIGLDTSGVTAAYRKAVSYKHLRAHQTVLDIVCRLLLEKKNNRDKQHKISIHV